MPSMESHHLGEDASRVRYWRSEAEQWKQRAMDLATEVDSLKAPCRIVFEEVFAGEVAERNIYKISEDLWPNALACLPFLESWPSIVHCGVVFAIAPLNVGVLGKARR